MKDVTTSSCLRNYFEQSGKYFYFLADEHNHFVFANDCLRTTAGPGPFFSLFADPQKLSQIIRQTFQSTAALQAELEFRNAAGEWVRASWEFSVCTDSSQPGLLVQAIGSPLLPLPAQLGVWSGKMANLYRAFEQSTEGLWRFDSTIPVAADADAEEIIAHWRNHSYLAECNDNMARMYGYEKAEELKGVRLDQLVDFSDEGRVYHFRKFIQNRFRTTLVETREFDRYGQPKYFLNSMEGVVVNGMLQSVWGTQQDITGQKQAEEKIRYLAMLMENVSDIIISQDKDFNIVTWNKAAEDVYGYSAAETIGHKMPEILHFEFQGISRDEFFAILSQKDVWKGEAYVVNRSGMAITVLATVTVIRDNEGEVTGYMSVSKDITDKRKAEEDLRKSEQFYRNMIAESQDGIVLTDEFGVIVFAAPSVKKVLGYEPDEVMGKTIFSFVHSDDMPLAMGSFQDELSFVKQPPFISVRLRKKDDQWIWCVVRGHNLVSDTGTGRIVVYFYDNTTGKQMMQALHNQAVALSSVFDLIITCDLQYIIQSWNKRAEQVVGYSEEEVKGKFLGDITKLDYSPYSADEVAAIMDQKGNWQGEISFLNREGVKKTVLHTASYLLNEQGERVSIIGTGIDITEKKRTEEQLKESELFYRNLFVNSLDGVLITDPAGVVKFASPSVTTIFGHTPEEIIGKTTFAFAHPDDRALAEEAFPAELTDTPKLPFISVRIRNSRGEWVWCIVRGHNLLSNPYIRGMVVYLYDDTLRKQTEQALMESENRFRHQATLMRNVTDVIVTVDMNRVVTSWNPVVEKLTGISADAAIGKPYREVIATSYHPFTNEQVFAIVQEEGIWRGEISFTGFDGQTKYLLHTISLLRDEKGQPAGMMGVGKDITERKSIEAQLQQSENFYRSLASNSLDGIVLTDMTGKVIYCGPSVPHVSGYQVVDLLGKSIIDFVHPDDYTLAAEAFAMEVQKISVMNYIIIRLHHAQRGWVWCTVRGHNLLHDPILKGIVIYFTDDTKRKMIEDRLRESERRFRNLIHDLKLGVILQNEEAEMLVCNQAALDLLGVTEDQLLGKSSFDPRWNVIHEDGTIFPADEHPVPTAIRLQQPVRDVVMGVYRPQNHDRVWLLVNAEPVFDGDKKLINVVCSFTDITEQRRMSQQLTEQEIHKQKLITQATIDGQEKERLEIGKELHDNISQHLTTTRLYLEVARDKSEGQSREMIDLAEKNLAEIVKQIRFMSESLVPPTLGDIGLIESIQDLCDSLRITHSFAIQFHHEVFDESDLPENMKLMIFRIIQEQMNNIIRHARASHVIIRLESGGEGIRFSIRDDGQGFDPQQHKKGMGLKNIINRAALFEGWVDIRSQPGQGCEVSVHIPPRTS